MSKFEATAAESRCWSTTAPPIIAPFASAWVELYLSLAPVAPFDPQGCLHIFYEVSMSGHGVSVTGHLGHVSGCVSLVLCHVTCMGWVISIQCTVFLNGSIMSRLDSAFVT